MLLLLRMEGNCFGMWSFWKQSWSEPLRLGHDTLASVESLFCQDFSRICRCNQMMCVGRVRDSNRLVVAVVVCVGVCGM